MKLSNTHIIHIEWDGPYNLTQLPDLMNDETDYGLYQIYGSHPVYNSSGVCHRPSFIDICIILTFTKLS